MRLSTKIFLALYILTFVPSIVLSKYILEGITPTQKGFIISFSPPAIAGLVLTGLSIIFSTICYTRFLKILKLSKVLFFSLTPLTLVYGGLVYLIASLSSFDQPLLKSVSVVLNITKTNKLNTILWIVLITIIYLLIQYTVFAYVCRPIQKIERVTEKLSDGRIISDKKIIIGKTKQFKKIENSLEKINYNYKESENRLKQTDIETQKFIPKQFLKFLGKASISELEIGNQVEKRATTLFCDLQSSTKLSTTLSLEENFKFINSYLNIISPLVRKYDGFVDKYLGDGILAVFPRAERALECAHAIIRAIELKNKSQTQPNIEAKISINTGQIIFGVVGEEERKSPTVVSDVVNLASKMEEINKYMGTKIVFSKATLSELPEKFNIEYRYIGSLNVDDGGSLGLFESLAVYKKDKREKLFRLKAKFENGVREFNDGNFKESKQLFLEVLKYVSDDKPSYVYYNKCVEKLKAILT